MVDKPRVVIVVSGASRDELSEGLRQVTKAILDKIPGAESPTGLFGGPHGYGVVFSNDVFDMHPFCWCEREDCPWCEGEAPNFHHRASGLKVRWYKYIGRGMEIEGDCPDVGAMIRECIESLATCHRCGSGTWLEEEAREGATRYQARCACPSSHTTPWYDTARMALDMRRVFNTRPDKWHQKREAGGRSMSNATYEGDVRLVSVGEHVIRASLINEVVIRFSIYRVEYRGDDEVPRFRVRGWVNSSQVTTDIDQAEISVAGSLKWDGCADFRRGDSPSHICAFSDLEGELEAWRALYRLGAEMMKKVDYEV